MKLFERQHVMVTLGTAALAVVFAAPSARCQTAAPVQGSPVMPSQLDRTQIQAGARAMGMGGTDLIGNDVSYAAYNPASIARCGSSSQTDTVVGRTSNVHVNKINDLSNGLKDLGNQLNSSDNSLTNVRDSFQKVYNFATNAGASDTGTTPATLSGNVAPLAGFSSGNVGIVGYGLLAARVIIQPQAVAIAGINAPSGRLGAGYGVLGITNIAIPFSLPVKIGTIGISPRFTQASYAGAGFLADETSTLYGTTTNANGVVVPNGSISGATYKEVHQQKVDADIGFTSIPDPIYHVQGAIVVHNLFSPTYHLPVVFNSGFGSTSTPSNFDFQMKPQFDLGALRQTKGLAIAAELHDLNNVNGGKCSAHLGVEYSAGKMLLLRGGYDQSRFVAGLGLAFGGFRIDLATGSNPQEQAALSLTFGGR